jgi:hypothetical protein
MKSIKAGSRAGSSRRPAFHYDGKTFPSREALAKHLAEITGRSWQACVAWLQRFDNDPLRVIEHAKTARPQRYTIPFENRNYTRKELAQRLAEITGRSWRTCDWWLHRFENAPLRVIEHAATAAENTLRPVAVGGRTFPSQAAFAYYIQTHYGPSIKTMEQWLSYKHLTPEECLERARDYRQKHRKAPERAQHRERTTTVGTTLDSEVK